MTVLILLFSMLLFYGAYKFYGTWLEKNWEVNNDNVTPAYKKKDGVDYVPAKLPVLFGHHFASIAGAAPIIGPIAASVFGLAPVYIWIIVAGIFIGAVHDFGALLVSIRNDGKNLGEVIGLTLGIKFKYMFILFIWLTSILVIAVFTSVVSSAFVKTPAAATSSIGFILIALFFSFLTNKLNIKLIYATLISLILMIAAIIGGAYFPLKLTNEIWMILIFIYIIIASVTPIGILLQPRDYLNSFLLFIMIIITFSGLLFVNPELKMPMFVGIVVGEKYLFPMLFVMVACGAISGYHAMFASTTTSKQLSKEGHIKPVAYGGMLLESLLAVISLLVAASFTVAKFKGLLSTGGPISVFSFGAADILGKLGIPAEYSNSFLILTISSFALTSLDSVTRVARFIFQSFFETNSEKKYQNKICVFFSNKYVATIVTVIFGALISKSDWKIIWPVFGSANQLIAFFTFVILFFWLKEKQYPKKNIVLPLLFMFLVTTTSLAFLIKTNFQTKFFLALIASFLLIICLTFAVNLLKTKK